MGLGAAGDTAGREVGQHLSEEGAGGWGNETSVDPTLVWPYQRTAALVRFNYDDDTPDTYYGELLSHDTHVQVENGAIIADIPMDAALLVRARSTVPAFTAGSGYYDWPGGRGDGVRQRRGGGTDGQWVSHGAILQVESFAGNPTGVDEEWFSLLFELSGSPPAWPSGSLAAPDEGETTGASRGAFHDFQVLVFWEFEDGVYTATGAAADEVEEDCPPDTCWWEIEYVPVCPGSPNAALGGYTATQVAKECGGSRSRRMRPAGTVNTGYGTFPKFRQWGQGGPCPAGPFTVTITYTGNSALGCTDMKVVATGTAEETEDEGSCLFVDNTYRITEGPYGVELRCDSGQWKVFHRTATGPTPASGARFDGGGSPTGSYLFNAAASTGLCGDVDPDPGVEDIQCCTASCSVS